MTEENKDFGQKTGKITTLNKSTSLSALRNNPSSTTSTSTAISKPKGFVSFRQHAENLLAQDKVNLPSTHNSNLSPNSIRNLINPFGFLSLDKKPQQIFESKNDTSSELREFNLVHHQHQTHNLNNARESPSKMVRSPSLNSFFSFNRNENNQNFRESNNSPPQTTVLNLKKTSSSTYLPEPEDGNNFEPNHHLRTEINQPYEHFKNYNININKNQTNPYLSSHPQPSFDSFPINRHVGINEEKRTPQKPQRVIFPSPNANRFKLPMPPTNHFKPLSADKPVKKSQGWKFPTEKIKNEEFLLMKLLGKGGSGEVHLVIEKETKQLYALKKVNFYGMDNSSFQECVNEIELLHQLKDTELVINIHSWEKNMVDKTMKIIMEYGHCDLQTTLKTPTDSIIRIKYIWEQMLKIVATIHSKGIVHADLKPANFVWVGEKLKLIDFGLASRLQNDNTSIATLNPKGTINFVSPETLTPDDTGRTKISPKTDVWSLGCILYLMVYGKTPFQDINHMVAKTDAILRGHVNYPNPPEFLQNSGVISVLKSCFDTNPKVRPTAIQLLYHPFLRSECITNNNNNVLNKNHHNFLE